MLQRARRLGRVVAQEIHCLAYLRHRIGGGFTGFAYDQAQQGSHARFQNICGAQQHGGAGGDGRCGPARRGGRGAGQGGFHLRWGGRGHVPHDIAQIGRVTHRLPRPLPRAPIRPGTGLHRVRQQGQLPLVTEIEPGRVCPHRCEQVARRRDPLVREACAHLRHRVRHQLRLGHGRVLDAVYEGRVSAVFQQAAHKVGQQRFMRADGGIDAARDAKLGGADDLFIQRLAHAMQALELVPARRVGPGHRVNGGERVGVVGGKLRKYRIRRVQQRPGTGEVADVRVQLAGEHRKTRLAVDLGALDLAIPIRPFHQSQHDAVAGEPGEIDHPGDDGWRAFLVGLHDEADPVPARQRRVETEGLQ